MKILIVGAGGVGGYFGAHLLRAGADVTFLLREKRKSLIDAQGLRIETPQGNFTVNPKTVIAASLTPIYDLIILAPKSYDIADVLNSIEQARGHAVLLPFLNGIDHLQILDQRFGRESVMGGVAHIAATITETGAVRRLADIQRLTVGHRAPAHEALARSFIALCQRAPFDSSYAENIEQVLWDKWVFLATLAGMTTLCRGSVGEIVATPYGENLMRKMFDECCAVAGLSGNPISHETIEKSLATLTAKGSGFTASMLRDLQSGKQTEHEHILGAMAARGMAFGLPMDLVSLAHTHMAVQARKLPG